jgi:ADP-ribose pyrophosphatase
MEVPVPNGPEKVTYKGKVIEVIERPMKIGAKEVTFELARRAPGTRLIIETPDENILLTKEFRSELKTYDYRLPGGKVFDSLEEYNKFLNGSGDILAQARLAALKEAHEEVGVDTKNAEFFAISKCGATVEWDLYYFVIKEFSQHSQDLEEGEDITIVPTSREEVRIMCLDGRIQEDRSAAILLRYLNK